MSLCLFLSNEIVLFFFMIKCTISLRVGKLCWHDFECFILAYASMINVIMSIMRLLVFGKKIIIRFYCTNNSNLM